MNVPSTPSPDERTALMGDRKDDNDEVRLETFVLGDSSEENLVSTARPVGLSSASMPEAFKYVEKPNMAKYVEQSTPNNFLGFFHFTLYLPSLLRSVTVSPDDLFDYTSTFPLRMNIFHSFHFSFLPLRKPTHFSLLDRLCCPRSRCPK